MRKSGPMAEKSKEVAAPEEKARPAGRGRTLRQYALMTAISAFVCAASLFAYDGFFALKIATLDVKGYVSEQRDLYFAGKISDEELRENIEKLRSLVRSQPRNVVILTEDVVVKERSIGKEAKR